MADAGTVQSLIAPRRSIQGRGVLASICGHVAELGQQPLLIATRAGSRPWPGWPWPSCPGTR